MVGHRMVFHILTAEGDLKDVYAIPTEYTPMWGNGDSRDDIYKSVAEMTVILNNLQVRANSWSSIDRKKAEALVVVTTS